MPVEYVVGLLVAGMSAVWLLYKQSIDRTIEAIENTCAAKDEENRWLRAQLESRTEILDSLVRTAEKLTETRP